MKSIGLWPALLALSACHPRGDAHHAGPGAGENGVITVSDARLVLPAVPGNPAAAYFTIANGTSTAAVINAAAVKGAANAEMHETAGNAMNPLDSVTVPAGGRVVFAPGGKHVMVFGLAPILVASGSTTLTLTLANGAKLSAPAKVQAAGAALGASDGMAGIKM